MFWPFFFFLVLFLSFAFAAIFAECACAGHISFWDAADRSMDVVGAVDASGMCIIFFFSFFFFLLLRCRIPISMWWQGHDQRYGYFYIFLKVLCSTKLQCCKWNYFLILFLDNFLRRIDSEVLIKYF